MVRPIDLQDNLSKTQAAERMNQIQKAQGEMMQRQVAEALKEKTTAEMEKPKASEKTDMVIIREDQKKQQEQRRRDKKRREVSKDADDDQPDHLDLTG